MSELSTISKVFFVLGFLAVLAVLIFGASGPTLIPNPQAPTFSNPFDVRGYNTQALLTDGHVFQTIRVNNSFNDTNCSNITYFRCLPDRSGPDFNLTYISLNPANVSQFNFTTGFYPDSDARPGIYVQGADWTRFRSFQVEVWCRWTTVPSNGNRSVAIVFIQDIDARNHQVFGANDIELCPSGDWGHVTFIKDTFGGAPDTANAQMSIDISSSFGPNDGILDVSTVYINIFFAGNAQCTGNGFFGDLSCQFVNFTNFIVDLAHWFINVLLFIGGWLLFGVVFVTNFIVIISWLYAIPGAPTSVQLFISAVFTGCFGMLIITIIKLVRGSSP